MGGNPPLSYWWRSHVVAGVNPPPAARCQSHPTNLSQILIIHSDMGANEAKVIACVYDHE